MDALQTTHCASEDGDSQRTATFSPSLSQDSKVWVCLLHRTVMSLAHVLWSRSSISVWDESPAWVTLYLDSGGEAELRSGCSWKEPIVGLCWSCLVLLPSLSLWMKRRERVCATSTGGISAEAVFYLWSLFTRRTLMFPHFFCPWNSRLHSCMLWTDVSEASMPVTLSGKAHSHKACRRDHWHPRAAE